MEQLKVIGWTTYDSKCQNIIVTPDNQQEVMQSVVSAIKENGYVFCGDQHQSSSVFGVPVFNNGKCYRASMRAFALMMAIAHETNSYMDYYMAISCEAEEFKFPTTQVDPSVFVFHDGHDAVLPVIIQPDLQLLQETFAMGMPFMTTDVALKANYDYFVAHKDDEE